VAGAYTYLGGTTLGYSDYADLETGRMLVAEPGGQYQIRAADGISPVPPGDGRWDTPHEASSGGPPEPPPVPAEPPVPPVPGGEA
jgi:hypothetical protein